MRRVLAALLLASTAGASHAEKAPVRASAQPSPPAKFVLQRLGDDLSRAVFLETSAQTKKGDVVSAWAFGFERMNGEAAWTRVSANCRTTRIVEETKLTFGGDLTHFTRAPGAGERGLDNPADKVVFTQLCDAKKYPAASGVVSLAAAVSAAANPARQVSEIASAMAAGRAQGPVEAPVWHVAFRSMMRIEAWADQPRTPEGHTAIGYAYRFRNPQRLPFDQSRQYASAFFTLELNCKASQNRITSSLYLGSSGEIVSQSSGGAEWSAIGSGDPIAIAGSKKCAGQLKPEDAGFSGEPVTAANRMGDMLLGAAEGAVTSGR